MKYFFLTFLSFTTFFTFSQIDTISIMYYNLLDFPSSESSRADTMRKIMRYVEPDLLLVQELESLFGANLLLSSTMNTNGVSHYARANYFNGPDTDNMLFYNSNKFGLIQQFQISTSLRDISEYHLYYKEPNMSATTDTIYLWLYSCHLKAGSTSVDEDRREEEAISLKNYIQSMNRTGNIIVGGDFNFKRSSEPGCQALLYHGTTQLHDPVNSLGNWIDNSFYSNLHTQSSRTSSGFGGGSGGGLDDRFDIIFTSNEVLQGVNKLKYLQGSYKAIGQDGNRLNSAVNTGTNTSVPQDIANALFYASDHLPVYMEMVVEGLVGVQEMEQIVSSYYFDKSNTLLNINFKNSYSKNQIEVYDISGKRIFVNHNLNDSKQVQITLPILSSGMYLAKISNSKGQTTIKFVVE
jgi:endonuclease/exonuclease/phosphatase family metal-dependent hydrolase